MEHLRSNMALPWPNLLHGERERKTHGPLQDPILCELGHRAGRVPGRREKAWASPIRLTNRGPCFVLSA
jgi:hypothetical protein